MRALIKITLRSPRATAVASEWVSVCILIGLALVSIAAAFDHMRTTARPVVRQARKIVQLAPVKAPKTVIPVVVRAPIQPIPAPGPTTEVETKTPEFPKMTENVPPVHDMDNGEADRTEPAETGVATVIARQKDLPMLRDDSAFETWGGEFANGDSRLKEMIQAGALTSVQKGAKVKILEVRGALAHIEVAGDNRTGWIRSASLGR